MSDRLKSRRRNTSLKKKFGINYNQYQKILEEQNHKCFICEEEEPADNRILSVDHCHNTGRVRGLLCSNCNTALGKFKDDISLLTRAIEYLTRDYSIPEIEETTYFIPHVYRPNWRRIVFTPDGVFSSNEAAAKHYNVHESTMMVWCGLMENKLQFAKEGFKSEKVYMSLNDVKEQYNAN